MQWKSLFAFSSLAIFVEKSSKCPHHHLIFIFIKSIQKPIYIHAIFTRVLFHSLSLSLYLYLSIPLFPFLSLFLSFCLSLLSSICLSCHSIRRDAEGGLMASLSGVFAAVLLQLLGCDKERKEEKFSH